MMGYALTLLIQLGKPKLVRVLATVPNANNFDNGSRLVDPIDDEILSMGELAELGTISHWRSAVWEQVQGKDQAEQLDANDFGNDWALAGEKGDDVSEVGFGLATQRDPVAH